MRRSRQRGLRFKLAIGISLTLIILLGVIFVFVSQFIRNQLWQREVQTAENLNAMAEAMIVDAMMEGNKSTINNSLNTLGRSIGGRIDSISIYDDQSTLTSFATGFPGGRVVPRDRVEITPADPGCLECHQEPAQSRPAYTTINIDGVDLIRNVIPLYNDSRCQTCHGTGQKVLGDSIVDIRLDQYESASTTITIGLGSSFVGAIVLVGIVMNNLIGGIVINPLDDLVKVTETIFEGDLNKEATIRSKDEVGRLGEAFNRMTSQLRETLRDLEHRVRDRTKELEVRSTQLQAAADVGRAASTILDIEKLINDVVELIKERFDYYYVGLFEIGEAREWAYLRAGSGEEGRAMLARGHRIRIGEGMVGWCIANAKSRIASQEDMNNLRLATPELPETRSEAVIPLQARGQVIGAISIQDVNPDAFDQSNLSTLQTLADLVSVAIDNARLYTESQETLALSQRIYGELTSQAWEEQSKKFHGVRTSDQGTFTISDSAPEVGGTDTIHPEGKTKLAIPIKIRDNVIGELVTYKQEDTEEWSPEELSMVETIVDEIGIALEGARLYQETQRRVGYEQMTREVSTKMRESLDIDTVLQTAASELRKVLGLSEVEIRMGTTGEE